MTEPATPLPLPRALSLAVLAITASVLPVFLTGSQAVHIGADLDLSASQLGGATSLFFVVTTLTSRWAGRWVDRLGWRRALLVVAALSVTLLTTIATLTRSVLLLGTLLPLGGIVNAVAIPTANLLLHEETSTQLQGLSFGTTQAAIPAAGLLAGAAVPLVAETVGWRWSFLAAAFLPVCLLLLATRRGVRTSGSSGGTAIEASVPAQDGPSMARLAVVGAIGSIAVGVLATFYVVSVVDTGLAPRTAAALLMVGSVVGMVLRIVIGWVSDRSRRLDAMVGVAGLLFMGGAGFAFLGVITDAGIVPVTLLAFAGGWSWPGLFHLAVVRSRPSAPGTASGAALTGLAIGAATGPLAFGVLSEVASIQVGWLVTGALTVVGGMVAWTGRSARH